MSPKARKLAKLIGELQSVTRRLKNYLAEVEELELWAKAAQERQKVEGQKAFKEAAHRCGQDKTE
jgi:hypothetical protein